MKKDNSVIKTVFEKLKKVKLRTLILLIIILSFNSYAWFVYSTKVSTGMSAHVTSWNISFQTGDEVIETNISIDLDRIYPGMETYEKEITVKNNGETKASLNYEVTSMTILGTKYEIGEEFTSKQLEEKIKNEYPFKISIVINEGTIETEEGYGSFNIKVEWPFESQNDELDTYWGEKAYEYYSINPYENSLQVTIKLLAIQKATT